MEFIRDITEFIFLQDMPEPVDAIFIPGNTWPQPAEYAAEIYRQGLAPIVIPSGRFSKESGGFPGPSEGKAHYQGDYATEADFLSAVLEAGGVPESAILRETQAEFTMENAVYIRRLLEERKMNVQRAIICCQAFHARRCRMYFEYVFRDTAVRFLVCPANTQGITRDNWMQSQKGIGLVLGELKRCGEQFGWMLEPE